MCVGVQPPCASQGHSSSIHGSKSMPSYAPWPGMALHLQAGHPTRKLSGTLKHSNHTCCVESLYCWDILRQSTSHPTNPIQPSPGRQALAKLPLLILGGQDSLARFDHRPVQADKLTSRLGLHFFLQKDWTKRGKTRVHAKTADQRPNLWAKTRQVDRPMLM